MPEVSGTFNNKSKIISILNSNGYSVTDNDSYISFPAKWRNGDDNMSVSYYIDSGKVIDWVVSEHFDTKELIRRVLNIKDDGEVASFIAKHEICLDFSDKNKIKQKKKFDESLLIHLQKDHTYPISRGISEETCRLFDGGKVGDVKGKLKNRYTWPIKNYKNEIVGFSGRTLDNSKLKYMHFGSKSDWCWPAFLNAKIINKCKSVILVESAMDVLYMWDNGIKNVICLFGTDLSLSVLNFLLKCNVEKIIISTNNEPDNVIKNTNIGIGNHAAEKIKGRLLRYFDSKSIIVKLPQGYTNHDIKAKDFCDMEKESLNKWINDVKISAGEKYFKYE